MNLVRENMDFTRGGDAYKKLGIGRYDKINGDSLKLNDMIELQEDLFDVSLTIDQIGDYTKKQLRKLINGFKLSSPANSIFQLRKTVLFNKPIWENMDDSKEYLDFYWVLDNLNIFKKIRNK